MNTHDINKQIDAIYARASVEDREITDAELDEINQLTDQLLEAAQ